MLYNICNMCGRQGTNDYCYRCKYFSKSMLDNYYTLAKSFLTRQSVDSNIHNNIQMRWDYPLFIIGLISGFMDSVTIVQVLLAFQYVETPEYLLSLIRLYNQKAYKRVHDLLFSLQYEDLADYDGLCCTVPASFGITCILDLKTLSSSSTYEYVSGWPFNCYCKLINYSCSCSCGCSTFSVIKNFVSASKNNYTWVISYSGNLFWNDRLALSDIIQKSNYHIVSAIKAKVIDAGSEEFYIPQKENRMLSNKRAHTVRLQAQRNSIVSVRRQRNARKPIKPSYGPGKNKSKRDIILS